VDEHEQGKTIKADAVIAAEIHRSGIAAASDMRDGRARLSLRHSIGLRRVVSETTR